MPLGSEHRLYPNGKKIACILETPTRKKMCIALDEKYRFISKKNAVSKSSQKLHSSQFALKIPPQTSIILIYLIKNSNPQPITNPR